MYHLEYYLQLLNQQLMMMQSKFSLFSLLFISVIYYICYYCSLYKRRMKCFTNLKKIITFIKDLPHNNLINENVFIHCWSGSGHWWLQSNEYTVFCLYYNVSTQKECLWSCGNVVKPCLMKIAISIFHDLWDHYQPFLPS